MNIHPDRVDRVILADAVSTTGKYYIFLGQHMVHGSQCYDIAAMARTGEHQGFAFIRHYYDIPNAKEIAYAYWSEFRDKMTAARPSDEQDEPKDRMVIRDGKQTIN